MTTRAQVPAEVRIRSGAWFPPSLVISTNANLVELVATVRDRNGHLTGGLHAKSQLGLPGVPPAPDLGQRPQ